MKMINIISMLIITLISIPAYSADKMRIAIMDLKAEGVSEGIATAVSRIMRSEFVNIGRFTVIERGQMDAILKEQGFQQTGCTDSDCAVQIGRLMSANMMLIGELNTLGNSIIMTIRVVDVEKGVIKYSARDKAQTEDYLEEATVRITRNLAQKMTGVEPKVVKTDETVDTPSYSVITPTGYYLRGAVPGWGQLYAGDNLKGYIFIGAFALSGIFAGYAIQDFYSKKSDYEDLPAGTSKDTFDKKYDDGEQAANIASAAVGVFMLVYIANWVDILYFTKPGYGNRISRAGEINLGNCSLAFNVRHSYIRDALQCVSNETRYDIGAGYRF